MIIGEFCDVFPPELDGVGMVVRSYAEELTKLGDTCYYVSPRDSDYQKELPFETLQYAGVRMPGEPYHVGLPAFDIAYHQEVRPIAFDLVHAHSPFTAGKEALRLARALHIPLVSTFHSKYYDDFYAKTHNKTISRELTKYIVHFYEQCDEVWTVNNATAQVLHDYGYRGEIQLMPNGTNLWYPTDADRRAAEEAFGLSSQDTVLLFVGQMNWKKNIRCVLDAVKRYGEAHPFRLLMVGQGPDESAIRAYVHTLELDDRVTFTGHIPDRDKLRGIYARADLFLFPSVYDNAPMVVREAAAAGTPAVLVRDTCAAEGVTDGENGFLCGNSAESLCAAILRALPQSAEVGARARATIPSPWSAIIARARVRYEKLVEEKAKDSSIKEK